MNLSGKVALVAGATRGAGRGIARMLGAAGARVYCSGRSTRGNLAGTRPETIDETAELINGAGGDAIAIRTDHSDPTAVDALIDRIIADTDRLDVLVNDIWGGDELTQWQPFWTQDVDMGFALLDRAVRTHIITSRAAAPRMVERRSGVIIEITDGAHAGYRGSLFYDLAKTSTIRLAFAMGRELSAHGVTALALTPGFLRSEEMLDRFGVTEANWRDAASQVMGFEASETPAYVGRAVAALAGDPNVAIKSGGVFSSWQLAREYGFTDIDGSQPHWDDYLRTSLTAIVERGKPTDDERLWLNAWFAQLNGEPQWTTLMQRVNSALQLEGSIE